MLFCVKSPINKLYVFGMAFLLAVTLAGCGGGGGGSAMMPPLMCDAPQVPSDDGAMCVDPPPVTCDAPQIPSDDGTMCVDPPGPPPRDMATPAMIMSKAMGIMALDPKTDDANTTGVTETKGFGQYALDTAGTAYVAQTPFDDSTANAANAYSVSVTWADGAAMATVTDVGADGAVDGPAATDTTQDDEALMPGAAPHAIDGWAGSTHTKDTEKVTVYSNIMAATPTAFAMVHTLNADAEGGGATGDAAVALAIVDANVGMLARHGITATGGGSATLVAGVADNPATTDTDETVVAFETAATFNGGSGMLKCAGATDCTATLNAAGEITAVTGTLIFTPAMGATVLVDDADHLHFGFWVKPPAEDGDAYSIQTFVGGVDPYDTALDGTQTTLTGSATYTGKAAGVYAQKTTFNNETGALEGGHVGAFTADASLMAYFGTATSTPPQNDVATNDQNTIRGTVSNFMDGENMIDDSWTLELMRAKFGANGMTTGGGTWSHSFFGPHLAADGTTAVMPSGVAGEFTGHFGNGHVAGAYGADKVME